MIALFAAVSFAAPLRVVAIGGGPDPAHNEASIERHLRWVDSLLPEDTPRRLLFADGDAGSATVEARELGRTVYRAPDLPHIDGPSTLEGLDAVWAFAADPGPTPADPLLLYFAGHGSTRGYSLWGGDHLAVPTLARRIADLPAETPVVLVMAQCHAGLYGDLLFRGGRPGGHPEARQVGRDLVGFFATVAERPSAGCTTAVNEAGYADFTTFFFGALTGADRGGHHVDADLDHDGEVGMDEAFAWAQVHDTTIDVPIATSDLWLRRVVTDVPVEAIADVAWTDLLGWATPTQVAALEGLCDRLGIGGDDLLARTLAQVPSLDPRLDHGQATARPYRMRLVQIAWSVVLAHALEERDPEGLVAYRRLLEAEGRPLLP
jgi:hypothetical protein